MKSVRFTKVIKTLSRSIINSNTEITIQKKQDSE